MVQPHSLLHSATPQQRGVATVYTLVPSQRLQYLWDHQLCGMAVVPMAAILEMVTAAAASGRPADLPQAFAALTQVAAPKVAELPPSEAAGFTLTCIQSNADGSVRVMSQTDAGVQQCLQLQMASATLETSQPPAPPQMWKVSTGPWQSLCFTRCQVTELLPPLRDAAPAGVRVNPIATSHDHS